MPPVRRGQGPANGGMRWRARERAGSAIRAVRSRPFHPFATEPGRPTRPAPPGCRERAEPACNRRGGDRFRPFATGAVPRARSVPPGLPRSGPREWAEPARTGDPACRFRPIASVCCRATSPTAPGISPELEACHRSVGPAATPSDHASGWNRRRGPPRPHGFRPLAENVRLTQPHRRHPAAWRRAHSPAVRPPRPRVTRAGGVGHPVRPDPRVPPARRRAPDRCSGVHSRP